MKQSLYDRFRAVRRPAQKVDPEKIPCIETSDRVQLCKAPLVSVVMVTYNHADYIRQAIESVMMQKTDFEFELIVGEDCSQDETREICFEYQRRFPGRIRVLWWHENVSKLGGNYNRCFCRCRGTYLAVLEGDDYWTDPFKLQKQVDLMRRTDSVMCVAKTRWLYPDGRSDVPELPQKDFLDWRDFYRFYFHTSTYMYLQSANEEKFRRYPSIACWYDTMDVHCLSSLGKVCFLNETVSVYRLTGKGAATSQSDDERALWTLAQLYDLALHGPVESRRHFAAHILRNIDGRFSERKSCLPDDVLLSGWMDFVRVHILMTRHDNDLLNVGIAYQLRYFALVAWFVIRLILVRIHLAGFILK